MNGSAGTVLRVVLALVALFVVWKVVAFVITGILTFLVPILIVGGVYFALTRTRAGRALIGGRRSLP